MSRIYRDCDTVLVYISRDHEIDTSGIIRAAAANGKRIAAPVCTDGGEMTFRLIRDAGDLRPGRFGIPQPDDRCPVWRPAKGCVCICPALCCDMRGHRLGFGGGYYDRFLSRFDGIRVGLCYADSIIPALPSESWDIPLDAIFTDSFVRYHHKEEE